MSRAVVRAYAHPETRRQKEPETRLVVSEGSALVQVRMELHQVEQLLADLVKAKGSVQGWKDEAEERRKIRAARKAGVTLPLPDDQPMSDGLQLLADALPE